MQKITPHLWYDKEAVEAAQFYVSIFPDSKINNVTAIHDTPSGSVDIVTFELLDLEFQAISAGPLFKFNPSTSFMVTCKTIAEVDSFWNKLLPGGMVLMELGAYPFSERFGWLQDKYGLSWQIIFPGGADVKRKIIPMIMFVGSVCGKAEEAINLWTSVFRDANVGAFMHGLFRQGAFQGSTPREAYFVKCDKETTTQNDINQGIVNIIVGFAPLKPAEFVILKIQQMAGQIEV